MGKYKKRVIFLVLIGSVNWTEGWLVTPLRRYFTKTAEELDPSNFEHLNPFLEELRGLLKSLYTLGEWSYSTQEDTILSSANSAGYQKIESKNMSEAFEQPVVDVRLSYVDIKMPVPSEKSFFTSMVTPPKVADFLAQLQTVPMYQVKISLFPNGLELTFWTDQDSITVNTIGDNTTYKYSIGGNNKPALPTTKISLTALREKLIQYYEEYIARLQQTNVNIITLPTLASLDQIGSVITRVARELPRQEFSNRAGHTSIKQLLGPLSPGLDRKVFVWSPLLGLFQEISPDYSLDTVKKKSAPYVDAAVPAIIYIQQVQQQNGGNIINLLPR